MPLHAPAGLNRAATATIRPGGSAMSPSWAMGGDLTLVSPVVVDDDALLERRSGSGESGTSK
jgi:hypothetical protein